MYNPERDKERRKINNEKMFNAFVDLQKRIEKENKSTDEIFLDVNNIAKILGKKI